MKRARVLFRRSNKAAQPAAEINIPKFPEAHEIKLGIEVKIFFARYGIYCQGKLLEHLQKFCFDSTWQVRRMVITKDGIYFALKTETTTTTAEKDDVKIEVMDYIPMDEIMRVTTLDQIQASVHNNEPMESANNTPNFTKSENKKKIKTKFKQHV